MRTHDQHSQADVTPALALSYLKEGNLRFVNNLKLNRNLLQQVNETTEGQWPFATILSCIDSRTSAELVFDQGLGDIFSIRIAGNVLNDDILGSMEYACKVAGSKLILVLGHSRCGAVTGACKGMEMGHLSGLLDKIQPAIDSVRGTNTQSEDSPDFVQQVTEQNVQNAVNAIRERSSILRELEDAGRIMITGAMYSVERGVVEFLDPGLWNSRQAAKPFSLRDDIRGTVAVPR